MGIGTSIFLIAVGAILAFAVDVNTSAVDLHTVGWILMIVGAIGAVLSLAFWTSWGGVRSYRRRRSQPERLADPDADLRILLCHFPDVVDRLPPGAFHLVLSGHLHAGQICVPWPGGRLRLAHIRWTYVRGLYRRPGGTLHLSAGLGTTFVPFRFLARPEATELVLESGT